MNLKTSNNMAKKYKGQMIIGEHVSMKFVREILKQKDIDFDSYSPQGLLKSCADDITPVAIHFLGKNPGKCTPADIHEICTGEFGEVGKRYYHLEGFEQLIKVLNSVEDIL
jgi:hypothetical protein